MVQSQRWCFTINNYDDHVQGRLCQALAEDTVVKYAVYGREVGEQGTPHLQGFIIFKQRKRPAGVLEFFSPVGVHPHIEAARASSHQAAEYCKKDGDYEEFGSPPSVPGQRNDFNEFKAWVLEQPRKPTPQLVASEFPQLYLKYSRIMEWIELIYPVQPLQDGQLRPWQVNLQAKLLDEADDRKIIFVIDEHGGCGKSWFQRWWFTKYGTDTQLLGVGKRDDLAHAIQPDKRFFLFDVPRTQLEYFQYSILEQLKNRVVFSPKYSSRVKVLEQTPHVVVFTNEEPDRTKLTGDRFYRMYIRNI